MNHKTCNGKKAKRYAEAPTHVSNQHSKLRFNYFHRPQSNHLFGLCVLQILLFQVSEYWLQGTPLSWHRFEKQGAGNGCSFIYRWYTRTQSKTLLWGNKMNIRIFFGKGAHRSLLPWSPLCHYNPFPWKQWHSCREFSEVPAVWTVQQQSDV